ncbi:MAG: hypothetical protein ACD_77C00310G0017 [uncultured bacterium]|nr:MAG: hypothetical protein ACD_77C00310G0017 [uncultured bacterium]HBY02409.1 hypothetical protein [Rikenellaceae bacterium]
MMDFISIPVTFGIGAFAFYKLIELFVRKKERLMILEKISQLENVNTENLNLARLFGEGKMFKSQFLTLRIGSLLMGLGLGLLIGYIIVQSSMGLSREISYDMRETMNVIYGASTLLFGGLGLVIGFLVEIKMKDK